MTQEGPLSEVQIPRVPVSSPPYPFTGNPGRPPHSSPGLWKASPHSPSRKPSGTDPQPTCSGSHREALCPFSDTQGFSGGVLHTTARPAWELSVGFCCQLPLNSEGRPSKSDDFSTWLPFTSDIGDGVILTENLTFDKVVSDFGLRTEFSSLLPAPRHMAGETVQPLSV